MALVATVPKFLEYALYEDGSWWMNGERIKVSFWLDGALPPVPTEET